MSQFRFKCLPNVQRLLQFQLCANQVLSKNFSGFSVAPSVANANLELYSCDQLLHRTSDFQVSWKRHYAKGGGKKPKKSKKISELIDDLDLDDDDDDDDDVDKDQVHHQTHQINEQEFLGDTPAAKFISNLTREFKTKKTKVSKMKSRGGHHKMIDYHEAKALIDVDLFWHDLEQVLDEQRNFFIHHLTLRSASALDDLPVELEGDTYPLRELAEISKKDPKRLVIDTSSFPQATSNIMKVLRLSSGLNLNPQQDGTRIYVPMPKVTREHREKLAKGAKQHCNETKDKMRKIQNKKMTKLNNIELEGKIHAPKENFLAMHEILIGITEHFFAEAEAMTAKKQKDLMESS